MAEETAVKTAAANGSRGVDLLPQTHVDGRASNA